MGAIQKHIHRTLAGSYSAYLLASVFGLFADLAFPTHITILHATIIAPVSMTLGSLLILWAQYTSKQCRRDGAQTPLYFLCGPYRWMRNPTHLGLLLVVFGYATVTSSTIFFAVTLIGYLISNIFFRKYEQILKSTYGGVYETYKKNIKKIL